MRVLVLGGTGAIGAHLVGVLLARGEYVTVTSRAPHPESGPITYVTGNAKDEAFIWSLLRERWDAIVDFMVYTTAEFERRSQMLLGATGHYVFLSSARVYADSALPMTESSPRLLDTIRDRDYLRTEEYALAKARQEDILFRSKRMNWTIIRPYITYSNDRLQLGVLEKEDWLYRALQGRTIVTSLDIHRKATTLTHGADVAAGIAELILKKNAQGEAFHITAPESILWEQVLDVYKSVLHRFTGQLPEVCLQSITEFIRWRGASYQILYDRLYDRRFDNSKIGQFIDVASFKSPDKGLEQSLEKFLRRSAQGFKLINWREEAAKDRSLRECASLSEISGIRNKLEYSFFRISGLS